ncbi:MAG: hypothetical protein WBG90_08775 [Saonia sp.]
MKYLILVTFVLASFNSYSQRVDRFIDSVALNSERTWVDVNGSKFTELGENCNYGLEVTFKRLDNQVVFHQCHEGEWKKFIYEFKILSDSGEHFIELYKDNRKLDDYEFEVQMIANEPNKFVTELSLFQYGTKSYYTLNSIK